MFKFDMLLFLKTMMTHKIRTALIVPPVALALARHPIVDKFDLSALSRVVTGAAPFPAAISEAITKRFGAISVQGYGLTETTPFISLCPLKEPVHGSIGVLAPNIEARIVDPETGKGESWLSITRLAGGGRVAAYSLIHLSMHQTLVLARLASSGSAAPTSWWATTTTPRPLPPRSTPTATSTPAMWRSSLPRVT
ncbi:hypothetical protein BC831DRAFT_214021 [Entophlyctis helioformis]|nr:hypothetical protein BC831DRAFT_214021 [Entophlyctis helioformis]